MDARDPLRLLFELLPVACDCDPISPKGGKKENAEKFAKHLQASIDELLGAHNALLKRIRNQLMDNFGYSKGKADQFRSEMSKRAEKLFPYVTERELKAFCYRLQETKQPLDDWLNSVASVVVYKPAVKWTDQDEDKYEQQLPELTSRFARTEGFSFNKGKGDKTGSIRLCVTKPTGEEKIQVLTTSDSDLEKVSEIEGKIQRLIKEHGDLALVATSKALWNNLKG